MFRIILTIIFVLTACTSNDPLAGYETPPQNADEYDTVNANPESLPPQKEDKWVPPKLQKKYQEPILIPGDTIRIEIVNEPNLTKNILIPQTGTINYQLIKEFKVVGKTVLEVTTELKKRLSNFIEDPLINVNVTKWKERKVYIDGLPDGSRATTLPNDEVFTISRFLLTIGVSPNLKEVKGVDIIRENPINSEEKETIFLPIDAIFKNYDTKHDIVLQAEDFIVIKKKVKVYLQGSIVKPGNYPIDENNQQTLWDIILLAGGPRPDADLDNVEVIRELKTKKRTTIELSVSPKNETSFYVQENDIITIPSKNEKNKVVSVFGEVRRPGAIRMPKNKTRISLVIGLAGGLSEFASAKIRVIRHLPNDITKKYVVDFDKILIGDRQQDMIVRGGDLIVVDSGW
ncbi:SLBB domain-containing protein [Candidatus Uabimicrobium sp. HlEnr_7]|uniref:polysaccharide biosynthesis/export family protein n=1 Tax=Candidatus Uabimicrobium helgolandensis TaxID=3095367 RepID=UPI0035560E55